jgi:hypothetical protein
VPENALTRRRVGSVAPVAVVALVALALIAVPLFLHFAQKRHDQLPFDVGASFPEDHPLVGGEVFATTLAEIMDHELRGGTGWRPNDLFLWGPTLWADNNSNRQLGILLAVRESVRVFKDHLTKVSSDQYDDNLVVADTDFRNDAFRFWFPSAESKYRDGVSRLRAYVDGLKTTPLTSRPMNRRNMELIRLMQAWTDMLGDAHGALYQASPGFFRTDDVFYHAQGVAYVMYHLTQAIEREYRDGFVSKPIITTLFSEVEVALGRAASLKPVVVLDGSPSGVFANHRRNLDAFISEARQKLYSIREELEK